MIFDMRLRPPLPEFVNGSSSMWENNPITLYTKEQLEMWHNYMGTEISPAALKGSLPLFFQEMEESGIDMGLVHARKSQNIDNDVICRCLETSPGKFIGCINFQPKVEGTEACLKQIDDYIINGPCKGILLEPIFDTVSWELTDPDVLPIYEKCATNNIPILFTIGGLSLGFAVRQKLFPQLETIAMKYRNLKIVLCHGGWPAAQDVIQMAAYLGNIYISIDMYLVNCPLSQDYIQAGNYMLSDRILFGSAYPAIDMREAVKFYKQCGFCDEVLPKIMGENALEIFNGKPVDSLIQRLYS